MKKAGIITIYGNYNYGNRLQNYAVQEALKKLGLDPETIIYIGTDGENRSLEQGFNESKIKAFKSFNENIKFYDTKLYADKKPDSKFGNDMDYYFIGSDQIWNYNWDNIFSPRIFADFASEKQKRIAFSASIGVSNGPEVNSEKYNVFKKYLNKMDYITVREQAGKEIVEEISERKDVKLVLDPTMMIDKNEWEKVMKKPDNLDTDKFVVKSFLGNISEKLDNEINRYSKENGYEILDISNKNSKFFNIGPAEFLYLEKNAKMVFTDSFHSCVFAIIFGSPFAVVRRDDKEKSMFSRIETLLNTFELNNRVLESKVNSEMESTDYQNAHSILDKKKKEAYDYFSTIIEK